jgi:MoxR-like ATPase
MANIFEKLGIFGVSTEQENGILATMLTGDPCLLIGKPGTAKTGLVMVLGASMRMSTMRKYPKDSSKWINYHAYDSSKVNFEDLIGFPDVKALGEGRVAFTKSPMTIWDKDLVSFDEFNRQLPERQNNIFEIVRSRTIMGMPTNVKWVINCMNPFEMAGAEELDEALVDRHMNFLYVNDFDHLNSKDKLAVVRHTGSSDAPALKNYWLKEAAIFDVHEGEINETLADVGDLIFNLLQDAAISYSNLEKECGKTYGVFISKFLSSLNREQEDKDWKVDLSGRRAGMIYRSLLSYRAIEYSKVKYLDRYKISSLKDCFRNVMRISIPFGIAKAASSGPSSQAIGIVNSTIEIFSDFFVKKGEKAMVNAVDTIYELITTTSLSRKIKILIEDITDDTSRNQVWTNILTPKKSETPFDKHRRSILVNMVMHLMTIQPDIIPQNMQNKIVIQAKESGDFKTLYNDIVLRGAAAFYSSEIAKVIDEIDNDLVCLQAKIIFEENLQDQVTISNIDFNDIVTKVRSECSELESIIEEIGIPDIQSLRSNSVASITPIDTKTVTV